MSNQNTRAALANRRNGGDPWQQNTTAPNRPAGGNGGRRYPNRSSQAEPVNVAPYVPPLNTREPTGKVSSPFILVEGGEKVGKSWCMAELSASPRVGDSFWLDLSEGGADEYGAIPGARYRILEHDGSWREVMGQIRAVHRYAGEAKERGDKPVCLFIDSGSLIWAGLSRWAEDMAKRSPSGQSVLRTNPDADVTVTVTHWNAARRRWREMMTLLLTFPGIVVMTARGKWVAEIDEETGKPVRGGGKVYKVEGERDLCFDATVWVQMLRDGSIKIMGARSVHAGIRPGKDDPKHIREAVFSLDWLIFEVLKYDHENAHVRDYKDLDADRGEAHDEHEQAKARAAAVTGGTLPTPPPVTDPDPFADTGDDTGDDTEGDDTEALEFARFAEQVAAATTKDAVAEVWREAVNAGWIDRQMPGKDHTVRQHLTAVADGIKAKQQGVVAS